MEMEWSSVTIKNIETKYEGTPGKALLNAVDKATELYNNADYKGALKAAKKILWFAKTDADKFWGHNLMARSLEQMHDSNAVIELSKAIGYCTNYYGSNTLRFLCHNDLGVHYIRMKMPEAAMKAWKTGFRFAETNYDHWTYYVNMGRLYGTCHGDYHSQLMMAQNALDYAESDAEIAECYNLIANSEFELSESDLGEHRRDAIKFSRLCLKSIEKILSNNQGDNLSRGIPYWQTMTCFCYRWMSIIYEELGEKDKAIEEADHALEYTNGDRASDREIYAIIARCYEGRKDGSAIKPLHTLLRYCDTDAEKLDVYYRLAGEYIDADDYVKAAEVYESIIKINSEKDNITMLLAIYSINGSIQLGRNLILKYGLRKDDPELPDFVREDPELSKYLK